MAGLHYASGGGIASSGRFEAGAAGFNLADVQSVEQLNALPDGVKGLVWLDQGDGVTTAFRDAVTPYIGNPKVYGFYLVDEPDPTGQWGELVTAEDLKAESDWIHANVPGAKTFITMMDMGSSQDPSFEDTYNPENTHIDLFGLDPYPVRSETRTIDFDMIDRTVDAAVESGIPLANIVPVYQAFGGGNWVNDGGGSYVLPTPAQQEQLIDHWADLVPNPAFDYAYSWISQNGDTALENRPDLQRVFLSHNTAEASTPTVPEPAVTSNTVTVTPPATTTGLDFTKLLTTPDGNGTVPKVPVQTDPVVTTTSVTPPTGELPPDVGFVPTMTGFTGHHHHHHNHHAWD